MTDHTGRIDRIRLENDQIAPLMRTLAEPQREQIYRVWSEWVMGRTQADGIKPHATADRWNVMLGQLVLLVEGTRE